MGGWVQLYMTGGVWFFVMYRDNNLLGDDDGKIWERLFVHWGFGWVQVLWLRNGAVEGFEEYIWYYESCCGKDMCGTWLDGCMVQISQSFGAGLRDGPSWLLWVKKNDITAVYWLYLSTGMLHMTDSRAWHWAPYTSIWGLFIAELRFAGIFVANPNLVTDCWLIEVVGYMCTWPVEMRCPPRRNSAISVRCVSVSDQDQSLNVMTIPLDGWYAILYGTGEK